FIFIVLVAGSVFLLVQGLMVPAFGDQSRHRRTLKRRLADIEAELGDQSPSSLVRQKFLRELTPLQRKLESLPMMGYLARLIEQGGSTVLPHQLAITSILLAVAGGLVCGVLVGSLLAAVVGAVICGSLPFFKLRVARERRAGKLEEQLPEAIDAVRRALRAGHPFNAALKLVAEDADDPIAKEFALTFADINYGNDVRRAMLAMLDRVPSVTMMSFVTAVLLQRETGGNLAEILEQIVKVVRGRFRFFRKVRTLSAEGRLPVWVLALMPLVLFGTISFTTPTYLPVLVHDPLGKKLIEVAIVLTFLGTLWIRSLLRIDV
ncbi:MAG: type II secretion system F family protein, partial [Terriglobales bacterium]